MHSDTLYGGITYSSTTDVIINMLHYVLQCLQRNNIYAGIVLIDFSKAFDRIDHYILIGQLINGVPVYVCGSAEGLNAKSQIGRHHI